MATSENWQLFVHNERHNYKIAVYNHGHAQSARLTEEQLQQTEQFRKSHKIYNVVAKIKKNRMQGRNTVEEVLRLSAERGYTVFYRNSEDSNVLSDIVVAHPTSIAMIRTLPYVQHATLECVGMTPTGKNFTVAIAFMCNEQATTRHIDQNVLAELTEMVKDEEVAQRFVNGSWKKLINKLDEVEYKKKLEVLKTRWRSRPDFLHYLFSTWLNPFAHKFCRVWTSQEFHFGVETTNRAESEHSVLKLWLSTCHDDLDTVFLNIDSLIQGACELVNRCQHLMPIQEEDVVIFWRKLQIGYDIPEEHHRDMESEMCDLTSLLQEISTGLISNLREVRRLIKAVVNPLETVVTKGRRNTNSTKRDKSHWEYVSIAHRKIGKSSGSDSGSCSSSGSGSNPSPRGKGRPPRSGRSRGRGRSSGRSSLSTVLQLERWMPFAPVIGAMGISSRYES
ncbi:hypothetical protein M9H77_13229 [Catharanthus roseus]|uniref:Uncharacterized protein n=1 Tax=Catharanthus roseus TaxID=4058 RepID=A0ACC0BJM5_CATRO|nr:hypothetical protein M9H77_13229 [Catharanthus roseus]